MSRTAAIALAAIVLVVGIGAGIAVGLLGHPGSTGPVAIVTSPGADATATPAPTGGATPGGGPSDSPSSASPAPTPEPTPTPIPTPVLVPAPLTGVLVKPAAAERHVIAVMIDDQFDARPQSGLSAASVVWQAPAEGGIPRYMALFSEGNPPAVGPVRSSRLYFIAWASEWNAVYVHAGGSPQALALLSSPKGRGGLVWNADEFRWGGRYLHRVTFRNAPHNVYSDATNLRKLAKAVGAKPVPDQAPVWKFGPDAPLEARPTGGKIVVPYQANRITYSYDRATNRYLRTVGVEGKQYDAGTKPKTRIAPANVVIMAVRFVPLGDKKHRLDGQVTGSGTAWIATNGKTIKGTWKKKSFSAPTRFYDKNGKPVTLTIGQTFIQVIPMSTKITIKNGTAPAAPSGAPSASPAASPVS